MLIVLKRNHLKVKSVLQCIFEVVSINVIHDDSNSWKLRVSAYFSVSPLPAFQSPQLCFSGATLATLVIPPGIYHHRS